MAEDHRAHAHVVVDELVPIDVDDVRTLGLINDKRRWLHPCPEVAPNASGHQLASFGNPGARARKGVRPGLVSFD